MPGVVQVKSYVVGDDWRAAPYQEIMHNNRRVALIIPDLGSIATQMSIYVAASNEVADSKTVSKTISRSVRVSESYYGVIITSQVRCW